MGASLAAEPARDLPAGFYLLRGTCEDEKDLHLITLVKTMPEGVINYVNRISQRADLSIAKLEEMEKQDRTLRLEKNPLPNFELAVRQSIRDDKQHQLLFGTSGLAFQRALLVTQIEAATYILHLAQSLADEDPSQPETREFLTISAQWIALRDEGFRLLNTR